MLAFLRPRPLAAAFILLLLATLNAAAYYYVYKPPFQGLTVAFLDVGQGDSILIEGPTGLQMLVDGGRDRAAVRQLPRVIGLFDRTLDLVVETHPDADHIGGLSEVFDRYRIRHFLSPGIKNDTSPTRRLEAKVREEKGLAPTRARRGERVHLGGGAYADVLYPDHDVSESETNAGSVALRVVYGETAFMLTGDLPSAGEEYLVRLSEEGALRSDVLKAGHHGSRTSTSEEWLKSVAPAIVVISAGEGNSYGHPHEEVLERIRGAGSSVMTTMDDGTLTFVSDGERVREI